ncbi:O-antigen/teichoic acid export membrane protein [Sphingobium boeckii]|uniref:O-antigen/teichoic acid export membrane protein n=1 Tax=Sphingobium boeckii TaxID=1082345 RepID=A0A7W9AEK7_9SPHN|nr:O-antigen/teichoic acid export membrane protein [Sphingobium boeckii]
MTTTDNPQADLSNQVRSAVFWRSGSQIVSQMVMWGATLAVIRILDPKDYGLFAMSQVILALLTFLNGYGFASALIQADTVSPKRIRQAFGMLLLLNGGLAILQLLIAPLAAAYYHQPMVADLLRVQALLYLATPFIALPDVLLSRALDFRAQAKANFAAAIAGAATALACALSGWGVWTLVAAPIALFYTRAIALTIASGVLVKPSFNFRDSGSMFRFGAAVLLTQFFWIVQSNADVFIAGRWLTPHQLGIYAEALFLTQIFATKFVPPLNDVAFPAYSRLQHDRAAFSWAFTKALRIIMLATLPLYVGLAVTAEPVVLTLFGAKWAEMVPLVRIIAFAMPFLTLQILFAPATNAIGRPGISTWITGAGAVIMTIAFLIGVRFGATGLAWAWLTGFPLYAGVACMMSLPAIGVSWRALGGSIAPGLCAAAAMGAIVWGLDRLLPAMAPYIRLLLLVSAGGVSYIALLYIGARQTLDEILHLALRRTPPGTPER